MGAQDLGESGCFVIWGETSSSAVHSTIGERRSGRRFRFHLMPQRTTRSGGPPVTSVPPATQAGRKKKKKKKTTASAPVRTETERHAEIERLETQLAEIEASMARNVSPGQYGLTERETATGMQVLKIIKDKYGELTVENIGKVLTVGLTDAITMRDSPDMLLPPGLGLTPRTVAQERTAPRVEPSEDCQMLPRLSHELLLVTVIQFLVVKYLTDFRAPPPKILSPSQNLTLTCITHDASSQLSRSRSFFDLVKILKLVASASSDFFDSDREKHTRLRISWQHWPRT